MAEDPSWLDVQAASMTLSLLRAEGRQSIVEAIRAVYMKDPRQKISKGDIDSRVVAFSMKTHADRATVYRWLAYARRVFLSIRFHEE